jgi:enoyl-CoA hydratase/carnithine racemase
MNYAEIKFSTEGPIGILTLNNPQKVNALSKRMIGEIIEILEQVKKDERIRVMIINAEGKHFCAGHYLAEMTEGGTREYKYIFERCTAMMKMIHELPQPVIAQVHGVATAAGCQLVAWCDLAVAETGARFATPGVKIGLFCITPMVAVSRAIGRKAAMEMLMTGRFFSAQEAKELGLINRVVSPEALASETMEMAKQIAEASPFVLAIGKKAFYTQIDQTDEKAFDYATAAITLNMTAEDAKIGIKSFLEKSKPEWRNR